MKNITILFLIAMCCSCKSDQPKHLSGELETIDLAYIRWACDCARFVELEYLEQGLEGDDLAAKCIFIEPSASANPIPEHYYLDGHHSYYLRLLGQYYLDEGIPDSYEQATEQKPNYARVFRYDSFELVRK